MQHRRWAVALALLAVAAGCGDGRAPAPHEASQEYEANALVLENEQHGPEMCLGGVLTSDPPQCGGPPVVNWDWSAVPWREEKRGTTMANALVRGTYDGEVFTLTAPPSKPRPERVPEPDAVFDPACDEPEVIDPSQGGAAYEEATQQFGPMPQRVAAWVSNDGDHERFVANIVMRPGWGDAARAQVRAHYGGPLCVVERDAPTEAELTAVLQRLHRRFGAELLYGAPDFRRSLVEITVVRATDATRREMAEELGEGRVVVRSALRPVPSG